MKGLGRFRPSGPMLVAIVALVFAMTGSAAATLVITSKNIKDGTIQTKDLAKKTRSALKGNRGLQGPAGPTGAQGPKGDKGAKGDTGPATGAAGGDLTGNYPNPTIAAGAVTASKLAADEGWHEVGATGEPAFLNSWVNFGGNYATAAFYKDARGWVHLKGLVKSGTTGTAVFMLPDGFRPATSHIYPAATDSGYGYLAIDADGTVRQGSGGTGYMSLEPAAFRSGS